MPYTDGTYYSRTGNTRGFANQIHKKVGNEKLGLQTAKPYPEDNEAVKKQAMQELKVGCKPALKTKVKEIGSYDVIFVDTPIWWITIAAPVKSFLSQYGSSGKTIVQFITQAGSGLGRSVSDIFTLCPNSIIPDGLAVWGGEAKFAQNERSEWLRKLELEK